MQILFMIFRIKTKFYFPRSSLLKSQQSKKIKLIENEKNENSIISIKSKPNFLNKLKI